MNRMKGIKFICASIWLSIVGIVSPAWIGLAYMNLTGHGKGYAYDMGSEANIAMLLGMILFGVWMVSLFPAMVWLCVKCYRFKKYFIIFPIIGFLLFFVAGIALAGRDWFIAFFGVNPQNNGMAR